MFILGLIYLIVVVVFGIGVFGGEVPPNGWRGRLGGIAELVLFIIIGIALFWSVLNK